MFELVLEGDEFLPGETKTFKRPWNQNRDDGLPLLPGEYVARGMYLATDFVFLVTRDFQNSEIGSDLIPFAIE